MERRTFLTYIVLGVLGGVASISPAIIRAILARVQAQETSIAKSRSTESVVFYVAPNGNDAWSGTQPDPDTAKENGPFATIERARDAIRNLKRQQGGTIEQPVTVFLRGGTYFLSKPLIFTPQDSGTADYPIVYAAYQDEKPIISGGKRLQDWQPVTVDGKQLWVTEIPEVREGKWFFRQLWVNGERRKRSRFPKDGYLQVEQVPDVTKTTKWYQGQKRFKFREGDLKAWKTVNQAEVVVMTRWAESRLPVTSVNENQRIINFGKRSIFQIQPGNLYYIEHALEILARSGEWYLDQKTGKLYYMPMPSEDLTEAAVIAPKLSRLVNLQGNPETEQFVEYLSFQNLSFTHAEWYFPTNFQHPRYPLSGRDMPRADVRGFAQADFGVPGVIYGRGVRYCLWQDCTIGHINNYAIELAQGCQYNKIIACKLFDLGGGIKLGESIHPQEVSNSTNLHNHDHQVINCHIYDGGHIFHSAVGIWLGHSYNNRIAENHVHDFYYTGISIGWTWGYRESLANDNIAEFNHIHHIGKLSNGDGPILNELAGIYTLGQQPGTMLRSNVIQHITALGSGGIGGAASGMGVFLDGGTSYVVVENNLIYKADISLHQNYGRQNIARNNIFAFGREYQLSRVQAEPHLSLTLVRNIIYWSEGQLLIGKWNPSGVKLEQNLYWHVGNGESEILFGDLSWDEWQARGMDKNSLVADPLFIDPEDGDFRLESDSPAFQLGFQPISVDQALKSQAKD